MHSRLTYIYSITQLISIVFVACITVSLAFAMADSYMVPLEVEDSACPDPPIRREWRSLGAAEKQGYISAVKCLSDKPSKFDNSTSRFDDFALAHISEGLDIHYAAAFLPWHRHFIHTFEEALRAECLYSGSLAYVIA